MIAISDAPTTTPIEPASYWLDGGSLLGWGAVYSRLAHPLSLSNRGARFAFTKVAPTSTAPVVQRWIDHLASLGVDSATGPDRLFWRLAVRQRSVAINAQRFEVVSDAVDNARAITRRAADLEVSFAFFERDPLPLWVVRDGEVPVFVGLPHHYLVRVADPRASLAALVADAQVKTKVHEVN